MKKHRFLIKAFLYRLPVIQGSQAAFLTPIIALMELPKWRCPDSLFSG